MKKSENEIELCYGKQEIKINQEKYENLFNFMKDFNVKISKENVFKIIKGLR